MKEFNIKITDTEVYINGELQCFNCLMDKENQEDDLNKKAILSLVDEMGYEAQSLFEEMTDRLEEVLDEIDKKYDDDNDFLQDLMDESAIKEMIAFWMKQLLESTGKSNIDELTVEEILTEIEDIKGAIDNERLWEIASDGDEPINPHTENIIVLREYLEILEKMLDKEDK